MSIPLLVDGIDNQVGIRYSGFPDRLYLIDREGKVAYKAGRGPFGFLPGEIEQALVMLLLDEKLRSGKAASKEKVQSVEAIKPLQ